MSAPAETRTSSAGTANLLAQLSGQVRRFLRTEAASAGLLVAATVLALVWANSPIGWSYDALWSTELVVRLGPAEVHDDLRHWVNNGLMVFFFFIIGMEVRRELSMGELIHRDRLTVPALAAVAGLIVPVLIYLSINAGGSGRAGWGIVMATDTAFVLGALALFGSWAPTQLRVFMLSLSVVDDIGALSAIALFYSTKVNFGALGIAALCVLAFVGFTRLQVWRGPAYFAVGVVMWLAMHASGVHATIGGVVLGLLVSAYPPRRAEVEQAGLLARTFRQSPQPSLARAAKLSVERAVSPNERIAALLVPWTSYVVVPAFALANAGVRLDAELLRRAVTSPVTIGVFLGLVVGKPLGVGLASTLAVKLRFGTLPAGVGLHSVWGGAVLSGIGFTVSLFVVDLAFPDPRPREEATVGVLSASLVAATLGAAVFRILRYRAGPEEERPTQLDPPVDPERDHLRGPVDAPLELVEYGGLECPFCGRATGVVEELRDRFGDDLRYVFRHLPLPEVHVHAELAAEATEAADAQGAFWAMHDRLFEHQDQLEAEDLLDHAAALGLDLERFARELGAGTYAQRVRDDVASAEASGVVGTPTFFVNGVRYVGPTSTEELAAALLRSDPRAGDGAATRSVPTAGDQVMAGPITRIVVSPPVVLPPVDNLNETPDESGAFPRLTEAQIAPLRRAGRRRTTHRGEVLQRGGSAEFDFIVVLEGTVAVIEPRPDGAAPQVVAVHGSGRFLGGLNMLAGQRPVRSTVVQEPGAVLTLPVDRLRAVLAREPALANVVSRSFLLRRAMLIGRASELRVIGDRRWPASKELRGLLANNGIPYQWLDPADDSAARRLLAEFAPETQHQPIVLASDGRVMTHPTLAELTGSAGA